MRIDGKKRVLFLCVGNSCRSQMAEGLLREMAPESYDVHSAGSMASGVNPTAVKVMAERGIDISQQRSKRVDEYAGQTFDYVMTVCDSSEDNPCPVFLGQAGKKFHWPVYDPAYATGNDEEVLAVFRRVRDQIGETLERFVKEEATAR
jgi:arsenate reductase